MFLNVKIGMAKLKNVYGILWTAKADIYLCPSSLIRAFTVCLQDVDYCILMYCKGHNNSVCMYKLVRIFYILCMYFFALQGSNKITSESTSTFSDTNSRDADLAQAAMLFDRFTVLIEQCQKYSVPGQQHIFVKI